MSQDNRKGNRLSLPTNLMEEDEDRPVEVLEVATLISDVLHAIPTRSMSQPGPSTAAEGDISNISKPEPKYIPKEKYIPEKYQKKLEALKKLKSALGKKSGDVSNISKHEPKETPEEKHIPEKYQRKLEALKKIKSTLKKQPVEEVNYPVLLGSKRSSFKGDRFKIPKFKPKSIPDKKDVPEKYHKYVDLLKMFVSPTRKQPPVDDLYLPGLFFPEKPPSPKGSASPTKVDSGTDLRPSTCERQLRPRQSRPRTRETGVISAALRALPKRSNKDAVGSIYQPSTSKPFISQPSTSKAFTPYSLKSQPSTSKASASRPSTPRASTSRPSTSRPSTSRPSTSRPSTSRQSTSRPSTSRQSTSRPSTSRAAASQVARILTPRGADDFLSPPKTRQPGTYYYTPTRDKGDVCGSIVSAIEYPFRDPGPSTSSADVPFGDEAAGHIPICRKASHTVLRSLRHAQPSPRQSRPRTRGSEGMKSSLRGSTDEFEEEPIEDILQPTTRLPRVVFRASSKDYDDFLTPPQSGEPGMYYFTAARDASTASGGAGSASDDELQGFVPGPSCSSVYIPYGLEMSDSRPASQSDSDTDFRLAERERTAFTRQSRPRTREAGWVSNWLRDSTGDSREDRGRASQPQPSTSRVPRVVTYRPENRDYDVFLSPPSTRSGLGYYTRSKAHGDASRAMQADADNGQEPKPSCSYVPSGDRAQGLARESSASPLYIPFYDPMEGDSDDD